MTNKKYFIFGTILILIFIIFLSKIDTSNISTETEESILYPLQEPTIEDKINLLAQNNSESHEYIVNIYDCKQFSRELMKKLKSELNITTMCLMGWRIDGEQKYGHMWLEANVSGKIIHIESVGIYVGIINEEYYQENYDEFERKDWCYV